MFLDLFILLPISYLVGLVTVQYQFNSKCVLISTSNGTYSYPTGSTKIIASWRIARPFAYYSDCHYTPDDFSSRFLFIRKTGIDILN